MEQKVIFNGNEGEFITAEEASKKQGRYLAEQEKLGKKDPVRAQFYGKEFLMKFLEKKEAVGIRFYMGQTEEGEPSLVLVATDKYGNNLVEDRSGLKDMPSSGDHGSNGPDCPKYC
ncbi:hypothetical protein [Jiulongibacter sp. NS-SX5]|uniref:hypothetical protein n=1 Tax=Jiulongibacter sp. NS-SX5 TaxID=3463854 RepID=UPI004057ED6E